MPGRRHCINRIRLEFKVIDMVFVDVAACVLIESDWNLKIKMTALDVQQMGVLIESDWNLKPTAHAA